MTNKKHVNKKERLLVTSVETTTLPTLMSITRSTHIII